MPRLDANFLRQRYPQLKDASDAEITQLARMAFAPEANPREFENQFLGEQSAATELGRGLVRAGRYGKAGLDFLAGGLAGTFGDTESADAAFKSYEENMGAANRLAARRSFRDSQSAGDYMTWAAGIGGEALPALVTAPLGVPALIATQAVQAVPQAVQRTEQLMPNASTAAKAAAVTGMTAVNAAADAFIPARVMRGVAAPGIRGYATDIAQGVGLGAATPLAERAIAGATSGEFDSFERGGYEQIGDEVIEGAAGGGVQAGMARPVTRGAQRVADRIADSQAFSRFRRTPTGEVDLTTQVGNIYGDDTLNIPAINRAPWRGVQQRTLGNTPVPQGETLDMFGGEGMLLEAAPQQEAVSPMQFSAEAVRQQPDLFSAENLTRLAREEADSQVPPGFTRDMFGGEGALLPAQDAPPAPRQPFELSGQIDLFSVEGMRRAPDNRGAQLDMFGGETMPLDFPTAEPAAPAPVRNLRQRELDLEGRRPTPDTPDVIYVDDQGRQVSPDVVTADPQWRDRAQAMQREAQMQRVPVGATPDMFGGRPRFAPADADTPDTAAAPDTDPRQRELPGMVTQSTLLRELQSASKETGIAAFRGKEPMGGKSNTGIKAILESQDPVAAMREAYADGAHPKAELLDIWHERLTGRKISDPEPVDAAAPADTPPVADEAPVSQPAQSGVPDEGTGGARSPQAAPAPEPTTTAAPEPTPFRPTLDVPARAARALAAADSMMSAFRDKLKGDLEADTMFNLREIAADLKRAMRNPKSDEAAGIVDASEKSLRELREWAQRSKIDVGTLAFGPSLRRDAEGATNERRTGSVSAGVRQADGPVAAGRRDFSPAQAVDRLRQVLQATFGETIPGYALRPTVVRDRAIKKLADIFGHTVVAFKADGRKSLAGIGGVTRVDGVEGVIFLNADTSTPLRAIFGHEVVHNIRDEAPQLYDRLVDAMERYTDSAQASAYAKKLESIGYDPRTEDIGEEMTGNVVGHLFASDPAFIRQFGRRSPEFVRPLLDWVNGMIDAIKARMGGPRWSDPDVARMVKDMEALSKEVSAILKEYEQRPSAKSPLAPSRSEVRFLRRAQEQAATGNPDAMRRLATEGFAIDMRNQAADAFSAGSDAAMRRGLKLMTMEQIIEQFGDRVRGARPLVDALAQKYGTPFKTTVKADEITKRMFNLREADRKALADVMFAATEAEIHPDRPLEQSMAEPTEADVAAHNLLAKRYEALSAEQKGIYQDARRLLEDQRTETVAALERLISRIETDPEAREQRIKEVRNIVGRVRGPYFPLARFGDFVLIAKGAARDGRSVVRHFETKSAMERARQEMVAEGTSTDKIVMTRRDSAEFQDQVSTPFVESLRRSVLENVDDMDQQRAMLESINELVIRALPAASGAKNFIRRRNVEGYSDDAARALADSVVRAERYISNLNFSPDVNAAVADLRMIHAANAEKTPVQAVVFTDKDGSSRVELFTSMVDRLKAMDNAPSGAKVTAVSAQPAKLVEALAVAAPDLTPEALARLSTKGRRMIEQLAVSGDLTMSKAVADELAERAGALARPRDDSEVFRAMGQLGHVAFLGMSPAYWATNLSQVVGFTLPELGGKYGASQATMEVGRAMASAKHAFSLMADHLSSGRGTGVNLEKVKGLNPNERQAMQFLADRGQLDITQNVDLLAVADGESSTRRTVLEYITSGAHYTELFNRMTTGLAAYRLAAKSGMPHQQAMTEMARVVSRTQFNYAEWNKARYFQTSGPLGQLARPMLMFQQFTQNALYWWGSSLRTAMKGKTPEERRQARKSMLLAGAGLTVMGGVTALPLAGTIHLLANIAGQMATDDPGWDAEDELQDIFKEMGASDGTAQALTKGIFAPAGVALSERVGQGALLPLLNKRSVENLEMAQNPTLAWLASLFGPVGSLAQSFARAGGAASEGDYLKALEAFPVKGVADLARAAVMERDGVKSMDGLTLMPPEELTAADKVVRAVGFAPQRVADLQSSRRDTNLVRKRLDTRRQELIAAVVRADMAGDPDGARAGIEAIQEFNKSIAERYPTELVDMDTLERAVKRKRQEQYILMLTGGQAKNVRSAQLAMQLNPGLLTSPESAEEESR